MGVPERLEMIVRMFAEVPRDVKLQALLDYSQRLPGLPERLADHPERLHKVRECQTPFFLAVEVDEGKVELFFDVPAESPTVRGYAGILQDGLKDASVEQVLAVPPDFFLKMGLAEAVSAMRLNGMGAILSAIKRQVAEQVG
ncbi:MAG: SufE family protein [Acidimicrobiia bacterium]